MNKRTMSLRGAALKGCFAERRGNLMNEIATPPASYGDFNISDDAVLKYKFQRGARDDMKVL